MSAPRPRTPLELHYSDRRFPKAHTAAVGLLSLCTSTLDPIGVANHIKAHRPGIGSDPVPGLFSKLDAVICEYYFGLVKARL